MLTPGAAAAYVSVSVQDFGCGIPPENLPRIFEPFFTTKALSARRGTGLGLSMVYELAKKMEAGLAVESVVDQGSTFTLILPVRGTRRAPDVEHSKSGIPNPRTDMNPPTILIIEDDDFQYEIYEEALAKYQLMRVSNGSEALAQIPGLRPTCSSWTMSSPKANSASIFCPSSRNCCPLSRSSSSPARWRCTSKWRPSRGRAAPIIA